MHGCDLLFLFLDLSQGQAMGQQALDRLLTRELLRDRIGYEWWRNLVHDWHAAPPRTSLPPFLNCATTPGERKSWGIPSIHSQHHRLQLVYNVVVRAVSHQPPVRHAVCQYDRNCSAQRIL